MVAFTLEAEKFNEDVYISGEFTNYIKDASTLMEYNAATRSYQGSYVLKQGYYEYQYVLSSTKRENDIEGNKREANNIYEIFVWPMAKRKYQNF